MPGSRSLPRSSFDAKEASALLSMMEEIDSLETASSKLEFLKLVEMAKPSFSPLEVLPCAHVQPALEASCGEPGKMMCGACRLVSYCSKECQKAHWKVHKQDCKNPMRSEDWMPSWVKENREPIYIDNQHPKDVLRQMATEQGLKLWGNVPAQDVVNLEANENDRTKNLTVAFAASGDLRHVVKTINNLPPDFSGNLNIVMNDGADSIACRNLLLLLVLGTLPDENLAADVALHFWYSVFIPMEYKTQITMPLLTVKPDGDSATTSFGERGRISWFYPDSCKSRLRDLVDPSHGATFSVDDAQREYSRVMSAPDRRDYRDRIFATVKPSHRVALQEFRSFGILLPFGALNSHFNTPNLSLFSGDGQWLQDDFSDPLNGWDIRDVIQAGRAHGAQPEDIYGCLYFYLTEQLRMFANRLRRFSITFHLFSTEACRLAKAIGSGKIPSNIVPSTIRFDRVQVSNILDANYVGMEAVLAAWAPLLSDSRFAAIIGYFLNWFVSEKDGRPTQTAGVKVIKDCMAVIIERDGKLKQLESQLKSGSPNPAIIKQCKWMSQAMQGFDAVYDNWKPFSAYLRKQKLADILKKTKLQLRDKHSIVPHRLRVPLGSSPDARPEFPDDESWYIYTKLNRYTWGERFVEFCRE